MSARRYAVICQSVIGNMDDGFAIHYGFDGAFFDDRKHAIAHGFKLRDSDDFNIAVIDGDRVVSLDWMEESREQDAEELSEAQVSIFGDEA